MISPERTTSEPFLRRTHLQQSQQFSAHSRPSSIPPVSPPSALSRPVESNPLSCRSSSNCIICSRLSVLRLQILFVASPTVVFAASCLALGYHNCPKPLSIQFTVSISVRQTCHAKGAIHEHAGMVDRLTLPAEAGRDAAHHTTPQATLYKVT